MDVNYVVSGVIDMPAPSLFKRIIMWLRGKKYTIVLPTPKQTIPKDFVISFTYETDGV